MRRVKKMDKMLKELCNERIMMWRVIKMDRTKVGII